MKTYTTRFDYAVVDRKKSLKSVKDMLLAVTVPPVGNDVVMNRSELLRAADDLATSTVIRNVRLKCDNEVNRDVIKDMVRDYNDTARELGRRFQKFIVGEQYVLALNTLEKIIALTGDHKEVERILDGFIHENMGANVTTEWLKTDD